MFLEVFKCLIDVVRCFYGDFHLMVIFYQKLLGSVFAVVLRVAEGQVYVQWFASGLFWSRVFWIREILHRVAKVLDKNMAL